MFKVAAALVYALALFGCADVGLLSQGGRPLPAVALGSRGYTMDPTYLVLSLRISEADLRSPTAYRLEAVARRQGGNVISVKVYELPWHTVPWGPPDSRLSAGVSVPNIEHGVYRIVDETSQRVVAELDTHQVAAEAMLAPQ